MKLKMCKKLLKTTVVIVFMTTAVGLTFAKEEHKYIGVKKCSMCHRQEAKGNQYEQWLSTKHANAYKVLATPEAKQTAIKTGISGNPQEAPECLRCHVTAYGVDESLLESGFNKEDGVQCESCHGPGADYMPISIMKDKEKAIAAGLVMPTQEVCLGCHNSESPNFKEFNFKEFYRKIAHPRPKE
jgi:hypothetical protein